jgi:hypothetical protein
MFRCLLALIVVASASIALAADETKPFNGLDFKGWKFKGDEAKSTWVVGRASLNEADPTKLDITVIPPQADGGPAARILINKGRGIDLYTEAKFGDCIVEVEFMIPKGSNSGIYLMGEYELQIFDSYGKTGKLGQGDLGAIYSAAAPLKNAAKKPGEWQKFVIEFRAPRFEDGKKVANAKFVKVTLNDEVIQENVEVQKSTGGHLTGKEAPTGPLLFQGDHGVVAFRNIVIKPLVKP